MLHPCITVYCISTLFMSYSTDFKPQMLSFISSWILWLMCSLSQYQMLNDRNQQWEWRQIHGTCSTLKGHTGTSKAVNNAGWLWLKPLKLYTQTWLCILVSSKFQASHVWYSAKKFREFKMFRLLSITQNYHHDWS